MEQIVLDFISHFTDKGKRHQVVSCFTSDCCYWFAYILYMRFWRRPYCGEIMYDGAEKRFACKICGRVYDITGDVTGEYHWVPWRNIKDSAFRETIQKEYIDFDFSE